MNLICYVLQNCREHLWSPLLCYNGSMKGMTVKTPSTVRLKRDSFPDLSKAARKKLKLKVLRRKRFLR